MQLRILGSCLVAVATLSAGSALAQGTGMEPPEGAQPSSVTPETFANALGPNQSYGVSPSTSTVYDVVYGAGVVPIFPTSPFWLGATDGDNATDFFATPAGIALHRIDPAAGTVVAVGAYGGPEIRELGYDEANGILYGTNYDNLYTIDRVTGVAALVGPMVDASGATVGAFWAMDYHAGLNTLYGVSNNTDSLYTINTATGGLTLVGATGTDRIADLWYDSLTGIFYAVNDAAGGNNHYTVNPATGGMALIGAGMGGNLTGLGDIIGCGVPATCNWYCGTGFNIPCDGFVVTNPPVLGGTFTSTVSGVCQPQGGAGLAAFSTPITGVFTPFGELLVNIADPSGPLLGLPISLGDPAAFAMPVPNNPALCGFFFYIQAYGFGGGIVLHCAWECVVGH